MCSFLPNEMMIKILGYLTYDDLLVIRKIDDKFKQLIDLLVSRRAIWLKESKDDRQSLKLYNTEICLDQTNSLIGQSIASFKLYPEIYSCFKMLIISGPFPLPSLFYLVNLVHLELLNFQQNQETKIILNAKNLRVLNLGITNPRSKFTLDCCKLEVLKVNFNLMYLNILYPDSIQIIDCQNFEKIHNFKNLKQIRSDYFSIVDKTFLSTFKHLEEFRFQKFKAGLSDENVFQVLNFLTSKNVRVSYKGIFYAENVINDATRSIGEFTLDDRTLEIYETYLSYLCTSLSHTDLVIRNLDSKTDLIIEKLTNLKNIIVTGSFSDKNRWIKLLSASRLIEKIRIDCSFNQELLDQLPIYCSSLTDLTIQEFDNLNFCASLKQLKNLKIFTSISIDVLKDLIINLSELKLLEINNYYQIRLNLENVEFIAADRSIALEPKALFKNYTINLIDYLSDIFG